MLSVQTFTQSDLNKVRALPKGFKLAFFIILVICIPLSFVFGLLGLLKKGYGYWPTTIGFLIFVSLIYLYFFLKDYVAYRKDLAKKLKLSGEINVISKSKKKNERIIYFDTNEIKRINVYSKSIFDKIQIEDTLKIEITKYSKCLLKLEKNGENLLNDH